MSKEKNKKPQTRKKKSEKVAQEKQIDEIKPSREMIYHFAYNKKEVSMVVSALASIKVEVSVSPDFINLIQRMQSEAVKQEQEFQKKNKK